MNLTEFLPLDKSPATAAVMAAVAKAEARHFSLTCSLSHAHNTRP